MIDDIVAKVKFMWEQIKLVVDLIKAVFEGDFSEAWEIVKDIASNMLDEGKRLGSNLLNGIMDGLEAVGGAVLALGEALADAFVNAVKWALNTIVIDPINSAVSAAVDTLDVILGPTINFPKVDSFIPRLAEGGIVTSPTLALIGEAGPEAVVPLNGSHSMGGTNYITINVQGVSGEEVIEAIQRETRQRGAAVFPTVGTRRL